MQQNNGEAQISLSGRRKNPDKERERERANERNKAICHLQERKNCHRYRIFNVDKGSDAHHFLSSFFFLSCFLSVCFFVVFFFYSVLSKTFTFHRKEVFLRFFLLRSLSLSLCFTRGLPILKQDSYHR